MLRVICVKQQQQTWMRARRASLPLSVLANVFALPCMHVRPSPFSPGRFCKACSLVARGVAVLYALDSDALQKRCFFAMPCMIEHMHRRHAALLNVLFRAGLEARLYCRCFPTLHPLAARATRAIQEHRLELQVDCPPRVLAS